MGALQVGWTFQKRHGKTEKNRVRPKRDQNGKSKPHASQMQIKRVFVLKLETGRG
jgi:hypothetical protein